MFCLSMYILRLVVNLYLLFYCRYNCVFVYVWELHIFMELSPSLFKKDKILALISILVHHRHSCDGSASSVGSCKVRCRYRRTKRNIFFFVWRNGNSRKENEEDFVKDGSRLKNFHQNFSLEETFLMMCYKTYFPIKKF